MGEFTLTFERDDQPNLQYPKGYWHALTRDGDYDGVGDSPENAMADLINVIAAAARNGD